MTRTDYLRFVVAAAVVVSAVVGAAAAVEVTSEDVPDEAQVEDPIRVSVTLESLYDNYSEWTLIATTDIRNPQWNVTYYDQTGDIVNSTQVEGETFNGLGITSERNIDSVTIELEGNVPPVEGNYTYDGENTFQMMQLSQNPADQPPQRAFRTWEVVHYTSESRQARQALVDAEEAIQEANSEGVDVSEAETLFDNALAAYNQGNFNNAQSLASQAQTNAEDALDASQQESQQFQLILFAVGAIVAILVVVGAVYWYRQNQKDQTRLR